MGGDANSRILKGGVVQGEGVFLGNPKGFLGKILGNLFWEH